MAYCKGIRACVIYEFAPKKGKLYFLNESDKITMPKIRFKYFLTFADENF